MKTTTEYLDFPSEIKNYDTLSIGKNKISIEVIAEDGTEQQYEITIHKYPQVEGTICNIIVFEIFGGIGYGIYYIIKKQNRINKNIKMHNFVKRSL